MLIAGFLYAKVGLPCLSAIHIVQFSAKHEQDLDCGGGYIKLIPAARFVLALCILLTTPILPSCLVKMMHNVRQCRIRASTCSTLALNFEKQQ